MTEKRILQILVGIFIVLVWVEVKGSWLIDPDEPRYAEIPREMLATGDYLTPRLNGSHFFEKPPLLYWMNAAAMKVFGETPYAARLSVRLAGMGTALLLIFLLPLTRNSLVGWWAALIYLSAPLSFALSRINIIDGLLTFGTTLTFLSLRRFVTAVERGEKTRGFELAVGVGASIAVLSKGPVGIVLPGLVFILWAVAVKKTKLIRKIVFPPASLVFFILTVPWFVLVEKVNPGFPKFFFIHEHILRYATHEAMRGAPVYFFALTFLWGFLPWLNSFFRSLASFFSKILAAESSQSDNLFFVAWFFLVLIFFSVSQSKLIPYILPAFPAAAALSANWIAELRTKQNIRFVLTACWAIVYLVLIFLIPPLAKRYSEHDLAVKSLELQADQIISYKSYPQSFPWVIKHSIPVVDFKGELASDGVQSPDLFWNLKTFWRRWNSSERIVVCLHKKDREIFEKSSQKQPFFVGESRHFALFTNFNP